MSDLPLFPKDLMHHGAALRRVALAIVGDEALAEDVVQSAYVTVMERPAQAMSFPWLAKVVRNRALDFLRRGRTRQTHEALRVGVDELEGTDEIVERMETFRLLVDSIAELPEGLQQVLYLRYFEGLGPGQIAARTGAPLKTIMTRHARALVLMRERLGRHFGTDQDSWHGLLLAPLGLQEPRGVGAATVASGVLVPIFIFMSKNLLGAFLAIFLLAAGYQLWPTQVAVVPESSASLVALDLPMAELTEATPAPLELADAQSTARTELAVHDNGAQTVEAPTASPAQRSFFCRFVAAKDGFPVVGALVTFRNGGGFNGQDEASAFAEVASDANGLVEIELESATVPNARVSAPGYGDALFQVDEGRSTPAEALEVRLVQSASLRVRLAGPNDTPIVGAFVYLNVDAYQLAQPRGEMLFDQELRWKMTTGADGTCFFEDLPAEVEITVRASMRGRKLRYPMHDLVLAPGEEHEIDWSQGLGFAVRGRVLDQFGNAVAQREMWLVGKGEAGVFRPKRLYFSRYDEKHLELKARTDDLGFFSFEDAQPGTWLIGPGLSEDREQGLDSDAVAAVGQEVSIPLGGLAADLELLVHRGLYIEGQMESPDGGPLGRCSPMLDSDLGSMEWTGKFTPDLGLPSASTMPFRFGPLEPIEHRLDAWPHRNSSAPGECFAEPDTVVVRPPSSGLVLKLKRGSSIFGHSVVAATGEPCSAKVMFSSVDAGLLTGGSFYPDEFAMHGLKAGNYSLSATTEDGKVGYVSGLELREGQQLHDVLIPVVPGAHLRVRYEGSKDYAQVRVLCDDVPIFADGIRSGTSIVFVVPAKEIRVRMSYGATLKTERTLHPTVGEELLTTFTFD